MRTDHLLSLTSLGAMSLGLGAYMPGSLQGLLILSLLAIAAAMTSIQISRKSRAAFVARGNTESAHFQQDLRPIRRRF
jgi:hypothetical protein